MLIRAVAILDRIWVTGWSTVIAVAMLVTCACSHPPARLPPVAAALIVAPWCFAATAEVDGVDVEARLCFSRRWACRQARTAASDYGSLAGIVSVGECGAER